MSFASFIVNVGWWPLSIRCQNRNGNRMGNAAMAGVTGDFELAVKVGLIDGHHHGDHLSRGQLGFLVIFVLACSTWQNSHSTPRDAAMNCIEGISWSAGMFFRT